MTVHGSNMPHTNHGFSPNAANRAGTSQAESQFNDRMQQLASEGVQHAQEYLEKQAAAAPSYRELEAMKNIPDAYDETFLAKWKSLLDTLPSRADFAKKLNADGYQIDEIAESMGFSSSEIHRLIHES